MEKRITVAEAVENALKTGTVIPAFNIFYLPVIEPLVRAIKDTHIFGLIEVARIEWTKFEVKGLKDVYQEFQHVAGKESYVGLHLDHIPVIDEDGYTVNYMDIIKEALETGYHSVMVDGSRLPLAENISAVRNVSELAHRYNIPVEAELGAVFGHETGPLPPYEKLFSSRMGFTNPYEAERFVEETGVDWLSIAAGNIHGAITYVLEDTDKVEARLDIEHIKKIGSITKKPLVLHGGTGIKKEYIKAGIKAGIAKINIGAAIRKAYENGMKKSLKEAQEEVYKTAVYLIREELEIENSITKILNC
ncbi:MAG: class II fructose-bisphosphate aldolase [Candidatus Omnitrophica bacterium]|nr:class II fructose-bisphosphate aldolase [Candidatus Omnitrophota bacterium]MCM8777322.1 class II fructose-bisphosphate aldolase [Candidatus Omnitrophota bacterium]